MARCFVLKKNLVQFCRLGSEWRYVILSTVRSCPRSEIDRKPTKSWQKKYLGFVTDPNQINVGITRAQEGLCIIGGSSGSVHRPAGEQDAWIKGWRSKLVQLMFLLYSSAL